MNFSKIYNVIKRLQETTKSSEKILILKENESEDLKGYLKLVYDNSFVYNLSSDSLNEYEPQEINKEELPSDIIDFVRKLDFGIYKGNNAKDLYAYYQKNLSPEILLLLNNIIDRDIHSGVGIKTINKAFPKLIHSQGYMRCSLRKSMKEKDWFMFNNCFWVQEKMDGMFVNIDLKTKKSPLIRTRTGLPVASDNKDINYIINYFHELCLNGIIEDNLQFHGELVVYDKINNKPLPREISNGIINSIIKQDENSLTNYNSDVHLVKLFLWDCIDINAAYNDEIYPLRYELRYQKLQRMPLDKIGVINILPIQEVYNLSDVEKLAKEYIKNGSEGVICKNKYGYWKNGTSKECVKFKVEFTVELEVVGFNEGTGKNANLFGSIECKSHDGKLITSVSSSGFKDDHKKVISDNRDEYIGKIMTVKANNIMKPIDGENDLYSLFLPVFVEFRPDKERADTLEEIEAQYRSVLD